jgi:oxaloacetate decarboxylase alpha subunit/pyruvate carboxylase subunit B
MPTPVVFNNTVLRDGHQSLAATRMTTAQMLPAAPILDSMGFGGLETWGGATIDSCLRFLGENPFDRLRTLKKAAPKTPQIMLLRGQNIVQYTSFPDDVVEAFVSAMAKAGMDVMRIFDACNDIRNLQTAIKAVKKSGKHARGELCYTTSPVHTVEAFVEMAVALEKEGCDSVAIKDMSGVIAPQVAYAMVKEIKRRVGVPLTLHSHDTAGLAATSYYAAIEAGVDAVETSIVPFANGTSQPDTVRMLALLDGHARSPKFDATKLQELRMYFTDVYAQLSKFTAHANEVVDSDTLCYQVPGGMLSNFRNQLKEQGMSDKFEQVLLEIPYIRKCLGWIPLVTPTSQIVGTQAMLNVKFGRWKNFSQPAMDIALGKYGRTPGPIDSEVLKLAMEKTGQKPLEGRPADQLKPRMDTLRAELAAKGLPSDDEACVLHAMFPTEFAALHKKPAPAAVAPKAAPVEIKPAAAVAAPVAKKSPAGTQSLPAELAKGEHVDLVITVDGFRKNVTVEIAE